MGVGVLVQPHSKDMTTAYMTGRFPLGVGRYYICGARKVQTTIRQGRNAAITNATDNNTANDNNTNTNIHTNSNHHRTNNDCNNNHHRNDDTVCITVSTVITSV